MEYGTEYPHHVDTRMVYLTTPWFGTCKAALGPARLHLPCTSVVVLSGNEVMVDWYMSIPLANQNCVFQAALPTSPSPVSLGSCHGFFRWCAFSRVHPLDPREDPHPLRWSGYCSSMAETAPKPILHHGHIGHSFTIGRYVCS